jgi:hypothetical protein
MSLQSFRSALLLAALVLGAATFPSSLSAQQGAIGDRDNLAAQVSPADVCPGRHRPGSVRGGLASSAGFTRLCRKVAGPRGRVKTPGQRR